MKGEIKYLFFLGISWCKAGEFRASMGSLKEGVLRIGSWFECNPWQCMIDGAGINSFYVLRKQIDISIDNAHQKSKSLRVVAVDGDVLMDSDDS